MSYVGNTPTTQAFTAAIDYFSGTGAQTAFTLSRPVASVAQVQVVVNNVPQNPSTAYTVSGNTITFTGAPSIGTNNIYVEYTSPITQVIQPGQGTVGATQLAAGAVGNTQLAAGAALANIGVGGVAQTYLGTNVAGNGPAFSAYKVANQTLSHNTNTNTKATFDAETYDTNNNFTSNAFTPTIAGYYQVCIMADISGTFNRSYFLSTSIYKNGTAVKTAVLSPVMGNGADFCISLNPPPIYMNGTTDYLEMYCYTYDYSASGSTTLNGTVATGTPSSTTFGAYLARAA